MRGGEERDEIKKQYHQLHRHHHQEYHDKRKRFQWLLTDRLQQNKTRRRKNWITRNRRKKIQQKYVRKVRVFFSSSPSHTSGSMRSKKIECSEGWRVEWWMNKRWGQLIGYTGKEEKTAEKKR